MSGGAKAPKTPSAAEQSAGNIDTARAQARLANPTQITPWGSLTSSFASPNSNEWTSTLSLSPEMQQQFSGIQNMIRALMPDIALGAGGAPGVDTSPFEFSGGMGTGTQDFAGERQAASDTAYQQATQYLDPQFAEQERAMSADLANRGLGVGTAPWQQAMDQFQRQKRAAYADARNAAFGQGLAAQQQGFSQGLAGRGQTLAERGQEAAEQATRYGQSLTSRQQKVSENQLPLQIYSALLALQQGQQPTFQGVTAPNLQGVDWNTIAAGSLAKSQAQAQQQAGWSSLLGAGLGAGGMMGAAALAPAAIGVSDRRLKTDIARIGTTPGGAPIYSFRYLGSDIDREGVMYDEIADLQPDAAMRIGDYGAVDYANVD